jgi:hypothetical protein
LPEPVEGGITRGGAGGALIAGGEADVRGEADVGGEADVDGGPVAAFGAVGGRASAATFGGMATLGGIRCTAASVTGPVWMIGIAAAAGPVTAEARGTAREPRDDCHEHAEHQERQGRREHELDEAVVEGGRGIRWHDRRTDAAEEERSPDADPCGEERHGEREPTGGPHERPRAPAGDQHPAHEECEREPGQPSAHRDRQRVHGLHQQERVVLSDDDAPLDHRDGRGESHALRFEPVLDGLDHRAELHGDAAVTADGEGGIGVALHCRDELAMAHAKRGRPHVGERRRLDHAIDHPADERLETLGRRSFEQSERVLRARRQVELCQAVEQVGGERRDVDLLLDGGRHLVADVVLHLGVAREWRERGHEPVGVDQLQSCPRADDGNRGEQQPDDHQHHGHGRAAPAPSFTSRITGCRGIRRVSGLAVGAKRCVLGLELRDARLELSVHSGHAVPLWDEP